MDKHRQKTSLPTITPATSLSWLFLDLNSYFASVEQQDHPHLRGKPVIVVPGPSDSTCAIAASYEAKKFGIRTGTKVYEAKRLCPGLLSISARHNVYVDYHHKILEEIERHIPVTRICSIDEVACRLMENERTPEQAIQLARQIKQGIRNNVGDMLTCSVGLAPNAFLAKVGSDMQKPDGLTVLRTEDLPGPLFDLKLNDFPGIGHNMLARLNGVGIFTVEQLWNLQPKHARKIWGNVGGERFWYNLHGIDIPPTKTQKRMVGHSRVLDPHLRSPDKAYDVARQLTMKAAARLRRIGYHAGAFSLQIKTQDRWGWGKSRHCHPAQDNLTFLTILEELWGRMRTQLPRDRRLLKVSVMLHDLHKPQQITGDLFESAAERERTTRNTALSDTLDRINKRYGAQTVTLGVCPKTKAGYVGTKIAFNRIPDRAEFHE